MGIANVHGQITWLDVTAAPIPLEQYGVIVIYGDITERKHLEDTLKSSQEMYRLLAENSSDAVALIDADGTVAYVSPAYNRLVGYAENEMVQLDPPGIFQRLHPDDRSRIAEEIRRGRELKLPTSRYQFRVKTKHGQYIWLEDVLRRQFDEHGQCIQTIVNSRDISERKHAEKALQESEQRFKAIIQNSPLGIGIVDSAGNLTGCNQALADIVGIARKHCSS